MIKMIFYFEITNNKCNNILFNLLNIYKKDILFAIESNKNKEKTGWKKLKGYKGILKVNKQKLEYIIIKINNINLKTCDINEDTNNAKNNYNNNIKKDIKIPNEKIG